MHEVLTLLYDQDDYKLTDSLISSEFFDKYNSYLHFHCFNLYGRYKEKQNYALPECILSGSMKDTQVMVKHQKPISELNDRRGYGVAERFFYRAETEDDCNDDKKKSKK